MYVCNSVRVILVLCALSILGVGEDELDILCRRIARLWNHSHNRDEFAGT